MLKRFTFFITSIVLFFLLGNNTAMAQLDSANQTQPHFQPMRSFILVNVRNDSDLPEAYRWLYKYHVPESISQFSPYVTKYAAYRGLPVPEEGKNFGLYNWIMTEHYWLINPFHTSGTATPNGIAFKESYDKRYMEITCQPTSGELRPSTWLGTPKGYHPTVFVFAPIFWEDDFKGSDRTPEDGPNFRWLITFKYPDNISLEEGDKWFKDKFVPKVAKLPEVTRFISSKVLDNPRVSPFQRVVEIWFKNRKEWQKAMKEVADKVEKPSWATYKTFPYMEPYKDFVSIFLLDHPEEDHLEQYRGYNTTR